jgi:hypothetical protein
VTGTVAGEVHPGEDRVLLAVPAGHLRLGERPSTTRTSRGVAGARRTTMSRTCSSPKAFVPQLARDEPREGFVDEWTGLVLPTRHEAALGGELGRARARHA